MKKIKIAYFGGRILGYNCLKVLHKYRDKIDISCVITNKKDGIEGSDWDPPLAQYAKNLKLPIYLTDSLSDAKFISYIEKKAPEVILNAFCNRIIPNEVLNLPSKGCINFHYGKLPEYKGRFIVSHIILNDEKKTKVTAHFMEKEVDAGDIIFERTVNVLNDDTAKSLYMRCTKESQTLFEKTLRYLIENKRLPRKRQSGKSFYYPFKELNDCEVDLNWKKDKIERFIRAVTFPPISAAKVKVNGKIFVINAISESL